MKNGRYKTISLFLKFTLEFIFYTGLLTSVLIPFTLSLSVPWDLYSLYIALFHVPVLGILFIELFGIAALVIVRQLILIFKSVNEDNPFIIENANRLRRVSFCCFALFVIFLFKTLFAFTPLALLMTAALFVAGLAALVFAALFYMAVLYKNENDLTI